jgi:TRAP-type C4-dicarboxylate transport system substrate-binding protein
MVRKTTLMFAVATVLAVGTLPAFAQKQTLRMAYWAGPAHHMVKTQEAWAKAVEQASGGNLTIEIDKASLAKPDGQYDLIKNGVRDMVWHVITYTPGRFHMLAVAEVPFSCPNATVCSPRLWDWYEKHGLMQKEFTDTKLLNVWVHGPGTVHAVRPARNLDELKGLKIRAGGGGVPIAQALGMSPVAMPATEAHEALARGTVEAVLFPFEALDSFRLTENLKFHLDSPVAIYTTVHALVMNPEAFKRLTPANQEALMKVSGRAGSKLFGEHWDAADERARDNAKKRGNQFHMLDQKELERWRERLKFVRDEWLKDAKQRGHDGEALLKDFEGMVKAGGS